MAKVKKEFEQIMDRKNIDNIAPNLQYFTLQRDDFYLEKVSTY